jgi:hypothetical protein
VALGRHYARPSMPGANPQATPIGASPPVRLLNPAVELTVSASLCIAAAFSVVAVPLAMVGEFALITVLPSTLFLAIPLFRAVGARPVHVETSTAATACALLVVGAVTLVGLVFPAQHFTTNRDPGVYATAGLWLEEDGGLLMPGIPEVLDDIPGIQAAGGGFYDVRGDGQLYIQFAHLTDAVLGIADGLGGPRALVRANVIVGGVALLVFFALAQRLVSSWPAVIATAALGLCLPQIYFTRGPYSEPVAQLLLLGALAVVIGSTELRPPRALLSGLLFGAVIGSRIDGILVLCAFVAFVVYLWLRWQEPAGGLSRRTGASIGLLIAGTVATAAIGIVDLRLFSPTYLGHLWSDFRNAALAATAAVVLGTMLIAARKLRARTSDLLGPHRRLLADLAGAFTGLLLLAMAFVRPLVHEPRAAPSPLIAGLQGRQGLEVDAARTYAELSVHWAAWYLGWPLVVAAILGAGLLVRRSIRNREWRISSVLIVMGLPTLVYLWRPSIYPDQIWAMRRFVPFMLPLSCLCAAAAVDAATRAAARLGQARATSVAIGVLSACALLIPVLVTTAPFWDHREHRLTIAELAALCDGLDGRTTLVDEAGNLGLHLTQPIAAGCGVPVAWVDVADGDAIDAARAALDAEGQELVVVTARPEELGESARETATVWMTLNEIERKVEGAPSALEPGSGSAARLSVLELVSGASRDQPATSRSSEP